MTFFRSSKVFPICVLDGREYLFPTVLALQSHICFGWKLNTSLVFSMSAPPPFTRHPQHARSQARGLTLMDNGCVQLQGISNRVLSQKLSIGLSGPWWMAPSSVSLPINNPLAPRWARCPLTLWSSFPLIYLPLIISQCLWTFISNSWPELGHWSFILGLV